ncbi:MAG: RNA polymerase Rpb4 family protein [Thermoplasmata archaeon]|nr:RNA polymerase Rpb4 family protein [Thermoplasmata archaeon]
MEQRYVSVAEVKDLLEAESEARGYEFMLASQKAALDHAQKTCSISKEQADAIMEAANALDFVTENVAVKIADLLPEYPEDVRAIFAKERVTLEKEQIESILEIVRNNS